MKKGMIILLSISFVVVAIVVLCFTLFGLNVATVNFKNQTEIYLTESSKQEIINSANFVESSCVLFMDKQAHINNIEKAHPYIKVINIETVFPNNIVVHCVEREELFAVKFNDYAYYICDEDLKVLKILELETEYVNTQLNAILINGYQNLRDDFAVGEFISANEEMDKVLKNFSTAFKLNNRTAAEQKGLIKELSLMREASVIYYDYTVSLVLTDFTDFQAKIVDAKDYLELKINSYLAVLSEISDIDKLEYSLYIYQTLKGEIVAHAIKK